MGAVVKRILIVSAVTKEGASSVCAGSVVLSALAAGFWSHQGTNNGGSVDLRLAVDPPQPTNQHH
jgi:hypothetical protein